MKYFLGFGVLNRTSRYLKYLFRLLCKYKVLFPNGPTSVDFQPDNEHGCPVGYNKHTLRPDKLCKDKFYLTNDSTLELQDKGKYRKHSYPLDEFCILLNGNAKTNDDHFATICIENNKNDSRMA